MTNCEAGGRPRPELASRPRMNPITALERRGGQRRAAVLIQDARVRKVNGDVIIRQTASTAGERLRHRRGMCATMTLECERWGLGSTWDAGMGSRAAPIQREESCSAERIRVIRGSEVMEPRGPRSILQVVARQPGRYWRRRSPQVLQLLHSSYVCDGGKRAELNDWLGHEVGPSSGFPQRPCGRVRRKPKACITCRFPIESLPFPMIARRHNPALSGPRSRVPQSITEMVSKPSPELAAARKIADVRPTALRDDQNAKARRILGRRSRVTNSKATWRSAGRCNLDRLKSSNRPAATCLEVSLADFLALARSVIQASRPAALKRVDQGKRPQRR